MGRAISVRRSVPLGSFALPSNQQFACVLVSYQEILLVRGKIQDLAFAKEVFNAAKEAKVALDNISYTIMIDAAGQNGDVSLAKSLFDTFFGGASFLLMASK